MKLRYLTLIFIALVIAFASYQLNSYLTQLHTLQARATETKALAAQIENVMYESATTHQRLLEAEQRHAELRRLLPATLQEKAFTQQVEELAASHHIKVLASRTSVNSRPGFLQASLSITLETDTATQQRFIQELKSIPRRVHIAPDESRGKKSVHMTIAIYAVNEGPSINFTPPTCIEPPSGVRLPPLRKRLETLYSEYIGQCNFVNDYADTYREKLRLQVLQKENQQLGYIEEQLDSMP